MGSRYEVEVTLGSARELKNVNWRNGELRPYAVLWINDDDGPKCSTRIAIGNGNGENPNWDWEDDKVLVPLPPSIRLEDAVLCIDVVHATNAADEVDLKNPLVGSARLPLRDVIDDAGIGGGNKVSRTLRLKRPSGRPQGRLDVRVAVREAARYYDHPYSSNNPISQAPYPAAAAGYGSSARDPYYSNQPAGPYAAPPAGYPVPAAAGGYGYGGYGGAPPPQPEYGATAPPPAPPAVADPSSQTNQKNKMGTGTGLAVGAAAGVLGGLALAGGASYLEDKLEESVEEKVEEDLAAARDDDGGGGACYGDDDY